MCDIGGCSHSTGRDGKGLGLLQPFLNRLC